MVPSLKNHLSSRLAPLSVRGLHPQPRGNPELTEKAQVEAFYMTAPWGDLGSPQLLDVSAKLGHQRRLLGLLFAPQTPPAVLMVRVYMLICICICMCIYIYMYTQIRG